MIVKFLGVLDILAAMVFGLFNFFGIFSNKLVLGLAFYLIAKGALFLMSKNFISILDIAAGLIFVVSANTHIPYFIAILPIVFLIQKGVFSFLG